MKILNAGTQPLSNADVLHWISHERTRHAAEEAQQKKLEEDAKKNDKDAPPFLKRPPNFLTALNRLERELSSPKNYPYAQNPTIYLSAHRQAYFRAFALEAENAIQDHLELEWKDRLASMTPQDVEREYAPVQEMKCLTEVELLMIYNHAPTDVDILRPMIKDDNQERFTEEELGLLVDVVKRTLRGEQYGTLQEVVPATTEMTSDAPV